MITQAQGLPYSSGQTSAQEIANQNDRAFITLTTGKKQKRLMTPVFPEGSGNKHSHLLLESNLTASIKAFKCTYSEIRNFTTRNLTYLWSTMPKHIHGSSHCNNYIQSWKRGSTNSRRVIEMVPSTEWDSVELLRQGRAVIPLEGISVCTA